MNNYYSDFEPINLVNIYCELNEKLSKLGSLYNGIFPVNPDTFEEKSILLNKHGYNFGEQIYSVYAEIGCILQMMEN